jgi:CRP/FNR family transcriptional regulator, cyclic AMP receptor protein
MSNILELVREAPVRRFEPGETIMKEGDQTHALYILIAGKVEVLKDSTRVATITEPGAAFGELSILLHGNHTATVRALENSSFHFLPNPQELLQNSPQLSYHCLIISVFFWPGDSTPLLAT